MLKYLFLCMLLGFSLPNARSETADGKSQHGFLPSLFQSAEDVQKQDGSLESLLADVEKRYGDTLALLRKLNRQITRKQQALEAIRHDILVSQRKLDIENSHLAGQVKSAYLLGQQQPLKLLLNQQDSAKSGLMMGYYQAINQKRLAKLADLQQTLKKLDQLDAQRQAEADNLGQQLRQKQSEQVVLDDFRKERDKLLSNPDNHQRQAIHEISESKVKQLLASLSNADSTVFDGQSQNNADDSDNELPEIAEDYPQLSGPFAGFKGRLPLPVREKSTQRITSLQSSSFLNGVLISAKDGTDIHAVSSGKVVFANWLKGLGLLLIIRHDEQYMSLYAYNESLYKKKDEMVKTGDVIAAVGKSGGRSQPGLYFEIRQDGKPVDPLVWCKH